MGCNAVIQRCAGSPFTLIARDLVACARVCTLFGYLVAYLRISPHRSSAVLFVVYHSTTSLSPPLIAVTPAASHSASGAARAHAALRRRRRCLASHASVIRFAVPTIYSLSPFRSACRCRCQLCDAAIHRLAIRLSLTLTENDVTLCFQPILRCAAWLSLLWICHVTWRCRFSTTGRFFHWPELDYPRILSFLQSRTVGLLGGRMDG